MAPTTDDLAPATASPTEADAEGAPDASHRRHFILFQAVPSWLVSMLVHMLVLVVLGLMTIADPVKIINVLSASNTGEEGPEIEEFTIQEVDDSEMQESEEMSEPVVDMPESMDTIEPLTVEVPMDVAMTPVDVSDFAADMAPSGAALQSLASMTSQSFNSRSVDMKKKLLREYGGTESSEAAVNKALKWIALHQMPEGYWTFQHTLACRGACGDPGDAQRAKAVNAATAMALLPFLGAGQTHMAGEYKETVRRGLLFLAGNGKSKNLGGLPMLDFTEGGGTLYSHGLVTILLCEAYAMTEDQALAGICQQALNFTFYAQSPVDGGWRYKAHSMTDESDTSVTGWLVMAMKSGYMGHLNVPPVNVKSAISFLDRMGSNNGSLYGYTDKVTSIGGGSCTAIGLLCRMYTGWDKTHPGIQQGVKNLMKVGVNKKDIYYDYYAAQVMRHYGGPDWDKFNVELRDWLVQAQATKSGEAGSWHFPEGKHGPAEGGRLVSTSFSTMILEVYYRHMPLYANNASEDDFPL